MGATRPPIWEQALAFPWRSRGETNNARGKNMEWISGKKFKAPRIKVTFRGIVLGWVDTAEEGERLSAELNKPASCDEGGEPASTTFYVRGPVGGKMICLECKTRRCPRLQSRALGWRD